MYFGNRTADKEVYLAELIEEAKARVEQAKVAAENATTALKEAMAPVELLNAKKAKKVQLLANINARKGTADERDKDNVDAYGLERDIAQLEKELAAAIEAVQPADNAAHAAQKDLQNCLIQQSKYESQLSIVNLSAELTALEVEWMEKHKEMVLHCKNAKESYYSPDVYKPHQQVLAYRAAVGYR
ncbi:hypothetical protein EF72_21410 [Salmonella enterica]|nr:hypothetical protein [Salmonella enterica]